MIAFALAVTLAWHAFTVTGQWEPFHMRFTMLFDDLDDCRYAKKNLRTYGPPIGWLVGHAAVQVTTSACEEVEP